MEQLPSTIPFRRKLREQSQKLSELDSTLVWFAGVPLPLCRLHSTGHTSHQTMKRHETSWRLDRMFWTSLGLDPWVDGSTALLLPRSNMWNPPLQCIHSVLPIEYLKCRLSGLRRKVLSRYIHSRQGFSHGVLWPFFSDPKSASLIFLDQ